MMIVIGFVGGEIDFSKELLLVVLEFTDLEELLAVYVGP
jgi:hypothetical protein